MGRWSILSTGHCDCITCMQDHAGYEKVEFGQLILSGSAHTIKKMGDVTSLQPFLLHTNLIHSNSLLSVNPGRNHMSTTLSNMKFVDSQSQKHSNWMHPIFSHHCCHSNLGSETTEHQLIKNVLQEGGSLRWPDSYRRWNGISWLWVSFLFWPSTLSLLVY